MDDFRNKEEEAHEKNGAQIDQVRTNTTSHNGERWWDADDKRVLRKLDLHIMPLLCLCYMFAFLDRSNIGNAKTAGMLTALHMDDAQYQWLLSIFYISYIIFQVGVLGYKLFPPSLWVGCAVLVWGTGSILQASAQSWSGMMAARFFIGLSEACFGTGVALYLSFFYPRAEVGLRFAFFLVGSAIASAIAGSVAYGLQQTHTGVQPWRLIFIVEAAPTLLVGIAILLWLPNSISTARFLSPEERKVAEARLYRATIDQSPDNGSVRSGNAVSIYVKSRLDTSNLLSAFKDPLSYVNAALLFIVNVGYSSIPVYLPTILQGMGYTSLRAQAFSAPPYVGAYVVALVLVFFSDRVDIRGIFIFFVTLVGAAGYLMLAIATDNHTRYGAVWLVVIGLFSYIPLSYSWLLGNNVGESKKGLALVMFGTIGQLGPILGTRLFPAKEGPYYRKGMFISAGLILAGTLLVFVTICFLYVSNRKKETRMEQLYSAATDDKTKLQYLRRLDLKTEEHIQEQHRRLLDIAEHRERSLYFRYSL